MVLYEDIQKKIIQALNDAGFPEAEIYWIESAGGAPGYELNMFVSKHVDEEE